MKELADKNGFELIHVGAEQMDAFMQDRTRIYTESAQRLGLSRNSATPQRRACRGAIQIAFDRQDPFGLSSG